MAFLTDALIVFAVVGAALFVLSWLVALVVVARIFSKSQRLHESNTRITVDGNR